MKTLVALHHEADRGRDRLPPRSLRHLGHYQIRRSMDVRDVHALGLHQHVLVPRTTMRLRLIDCLGMGCVRRRIRTRWLG